MASTAFITSCCLGNKSLIIDSDIPASKSYIEINVISLISVVVAVASSLGIVVILCPFGSNQHAADRDRRYLVQSSSVNQVTKCLISAGLLANLGLVVRSCLWLANDYPSSDDTDFNDYKHVLCIVTSIWIQYFFLCVVFWHVVYALETFLASKGRNSSCVAKYFIGWFLPASLCSIVAFISYHPVLRRCGAHSKSTRSAMFAIYLTPIALSLLVVIILFNRALKEVKRSLIIHFGRFSTLERETLDNIRVKFLIIVTAFFICWIPNILGGILINERSGDVTLVFLVLECVLNPFQVLIDAMVMYGWPPAGCCGIFRSHSARNHGNVNAGDSGFSDSERDPLLSFSRSRNRRT